MKKGQPYKKEAFAKAESTIIIVIHPQLNSNCMEYKLHV